MALDDEDEARQATWLAAYTLGMHEGGVHLVSADDAAARHDYEQASPLMRRLGLSAGLLKSEMDIDRRKSAYAADVTFGSFFEFCCDYLRDNMVLNVDELVQRTTSTAVINDIFRILVGMADSPIILSMLVAPNSRRFEAIDALATRLQPEEHYQVQDDEHSVRLTAQGAELLRDQFGVTDHDSIEEIELSCALETALRARICYSRGVDYDVVDTRLVPRAGRLPTGSDFEGGLQQAIQEKESLRISDVRVPLATITVQEYFRRYPRLAGVTLARHPAPRLFYGMYGIASVDSRSPATGISSDDDISQVEESMLAVCLRAMEWNEVLGRQRDALYRRRREVMTPVTGSGAEQDEQRSKALIIDRAYCIHLDRMDSLRHACYPDQLSRYQKIAESLYEDLVARIDERIRQPAGS